MQRSRSFLQIHYLQIADDSLYRLMSCHMIQLAADPFREDVAPGHFTFVVYRATSIFRLAVTKLLKSSCVSMLATVNGLIWLQQHGIIAAAAAFK